MSTDCCEHDAGFDEWMCRVDALLGARLGVVSADLLDQCYRDWFDSGMSPEEAVADVLENEGIEE